MDSHNLQYDIGKMDSIQLSKQYSYNFNDFYNLNLQVNFNRNPFGQQSSLSNMQSVGRFQLCKNTSINEKGDIFIKQQTNKLTQENFDKDLDAIMLNKSIPVSVQKSLNVNSEEFDQNFLNLHELKNLPIDMTNSQDIGQSQQKQFMVNSLMQQSNANKIYNNDIFLDQSDQLRQQFNNFNPFNISQFYNESIMKYSSQKRNINQDLFMQVSLIDKKMETLSEPDQHVIYYDQESSTIQNNQEIKQLDDQNNDNSSDDNNNHNTSGQYIQQNEKDLNIKYEFTNQQENIFNYQAHSDEEQVSKNAPSKIKKKISKKSQKQNKEQKRVSKCRQSRHKNVFKNFGGTLIRFVIYNQYFQQRVTDLFKQDAQKKKLFQDWLQCSIKLERKKDFQVAWTTFKTDSETIREYKEILRELSRDFFENFSFVYLMNSRKISDLEIHLRSIHTYLAGINNPDSLERFKPI
ncbi:hypothetical protein ABPG74_009751 [Tetrahymena malaccensis]